MNYRISLTFKALHVEGKT